ncbi:MAG TPA: cytochrome C oxidase subunit IV family protein [Chthoniobacter sp.]|jgi:cytochrome c oxidase subunit 4
MSHTVVSLKTYIATFVSLMVLLIITVVVAYVDLGELNLAAAMAIAVLKAVLIILFFMHIRYGRKLTWVFAGAGFFWLAIMLIFVMCDYATRH